MNTQTFAAAALALAASSTSLHAQSARVAGASWDTPRPIVARTDPDGRRYVADELLIGLAPDADRALVLGAIEARGARVLGEIALVRVVRIALPEGVEPRAASAGFRSIAGVAYAEPNDVGEPGALGAGAPNDTFFPAQWHHENTGQSGGTAGADIETVAAWALTSSPDPVVLAILDTGIDFAHPEFAGRIVPGWDYLDEDADSTAVNPHGTSVAGLAGANADNAFGVAGVDRTCTIYVLRVVDQFGTVADLVEGLEDCATNEVDVVSMSLINYGNGQTLENALIAARATGAILVACAGNGGIGNADVSGPGQSVQTISIGATTRFDTRASYSGTGAKLDFVAPGDNVITVSAALSHPNASGFFAGCSAATPVAAGIVALLKGQDPTLTQAAVYDLLKVGAEDRVGPPNEDALGRDNFFGWGRLNARRSVASLTPVAVPSAYGAGKPTSIGTLPFVAPHGTPRHAWNDFAIDVEDAVPSVLAIVFHGPAANSQPWFGGTLLVAPPIVRLPAQSLDGLGHARFPIEIPATLVGTQRFHQAWFRDPAHPDGTFVGMTNALAVEFGP